MAIIKDIKVTMSGGKAIPGSMVFRSLLMGTAAVEKPITIIHQADWSNEMLAEGYTVNDTEYKMVSKYFLPAVDTKIVVDDIAVGRKKNSDSWTTALNAMTFDNFWLLMVTPGQSKAALQEIGDWAAAQEDPGHFFLGTINDVTIGAARANSREAYLVYDKATTKGYQTISSKPTPFVGTVVPALASATYDLDVTVDGGTLRQLATPLLVSDTWTSIASKIQVRLRAATSGQELVTIEKGKIKITSGTTGTGSSILIAEGTAGNTPLLGAIDALTGYKTKIDSAVQGTETFPDIEVASRKIGYKPYFTWKWKQVRAATAGYTYSELTTIRTNNTFTISTVGRGSSKINFTNEGNTTKHGEYIDLTCGCDMIKEQLKDAYYTLVLNNERIGMGNIGLGQVETTLRNVLSQWGENGFIMALTAESSDEDRSKSDNGKYMYKLDIPKRNAISIADRTARILKNVKFTFTVTGAIHEITVNGYFEV